MDTRKIIVCTQSSVNCILFLKISYRYIMLLNKPLYNITYLYTVMIHCYSSFPILYRLMAVQSYSYGIPSHTCNYHKSR